MVMKIACSADRIRQLSPEKIKSLLDADSKGEYILVDVRQPEEYAKGHLPGAVLIPLGELEYRSSELDRSKNIIAY